MLFLLLNCFSSLISAQWVNLNTGIPGDLNEVHFINTSTGIVLGDSGIFKTTDGGSSWIEQHITNNSIDSISLEGTYLTGVVHNNNQWFVVGKDTLNQRGVIFSQTSTGAWSLVHFTSGTYINDLANHGSLVIVVGDNGLIKYHNTSQSGWVTKNSGLTINFYSVHSNGSVLNIAGDSNMVKTANFPYGGIQTKTSVTFLDVHTFSNGHAYWLNYTTIGRGSANTHFILSDRYTDSLKGLCLEYFSRIYLGTENGILRSVNNPTNGNSLFWERSLSAAGYTINAIDFAYALFGVAVGPNGLVLKTTNKGGDHVPFVDFNAPAIACRDSNVSLVNRVFTMSNGTSYTWKINHQPISSNGIHASTTFIDTGYHYITLVGDNGEVIDSLTKSIYIVPLPDTTLAISLSDTFFCHTGQSDITIHGSHSGIEYSILDAADHSIIETQSGSGGDLTFSLPLVTITSEYLVKAQYHNMACPLLFPDTFRVIVDNVQANFKAQFINTGLNQPVKIKNTSQGAVSYQWSFSGGASITSSTDVEPTVSFSQIGPKSATLVAISANGCTDTITGTVTEVYNYQGAIDDCWALNFNAPDTGSYDHDRNEIVELAPNGDVIVAGSFRENEFTTKAGISSGVKSGAGFFIARYSPNGVVKWVVHAVDTSSFFVYMPPIGTNYSARGSAFDLVVDASGNITATGWATEDFLLYDNLGKVIPMNQYNEGFILRLNSEGVYQWQTGMDLAVAKQITQDATGNLYLSGTYRHSALFYSRDSTIHTKTTSGVTKNFFMKMNGNGVIQWITQIDNAVGSGNYSKSGLEADANGNCYLSGFFTGNSTFRAVSGSDLTINYQSSLDGYLVKYNPQGNLEWGHNLNSVTHTSTTIDRATSLAIGSDDNIYVGLRAGSNFTGQAVIAPSVNKPADSVFGGNFVMLSYDPNGDYRWGVGSQYNVLGSNTSLATDQYGNIYASGTAYDHYLDTINFICTDSTSIGLPNNLGSFFISKYDSRGSLLWATLESGLNSNNMGSINGPRAMAVDQSQNVFVVGEFYNHSPVYSIAGDSINSSWEQPFMARFNANACLQTDSLISLASGPWCGGDSAWVPFLASPNISFGSGNTYQIQLSDSLGSFANSLILANYSSSKNSDSIRVFIPDSILEGTYQLRSVSSSPAITGSQTSVFIKPQPVAKSSSYSVCPGTQLSLEASEGTSYTWSSSADAGDTNVRTIDFLPDSSVTITVDVTYDCGHITDTFFITLNQEYQHWQASTEICQGDSALIFGQMHTQSGIFHDTLASAFGCDSVLSKELIVNPVFQDTVISTQICHGDSVQIFGSYRSDAGVYKDSLLSTDGCDSIPIAKLEIIYPTVDTLPPSLHCQGDSAWLFGQFRKTSGLYLDTLQNLQGCDSTVAKALIFGNPDSVLLSPVEICTNDSILIFGSYESTPGYYQQNLQNRFSCDSIVGLNLTLNAIDTSVSLNGISLQANASNASYQWLQCTNGIMIPIASATQGSFTPVANGAYAVAITKNGCNDTSACIIVDQITLNELAPNNVSLYPNPSRGKVNLDFEGIVEDVEIKISNAIGQHLHTKKHSKASVLELNFGQGTGLYFIEVTFSSTQRRVFKVLVKQ